MPFRVEQRRSKYGNRSTIYNNRSYHSKFEAQIAEELDMCRKAADPHERVVEIVPQYRVTLTVNGIKICDYRVDFYVKYADDREELVEVKGFETYEWRLKWRLLEAIYGKEHPEIELRVVKQQRGGRKNYGGSWGKGGAR